MNTPLEKLETELKLPIDSERQVTHILMLVRKVLDAGGPPFDHLRMMCNWAFHTELSNAFVRTQIEFLDGISGITLSGRNWPADIERNIMDLFSLGKCREDLLEFIRHYRLNRALQHVFKPDWWVSFLRNYIKVVLGSPLLLKGKDLRVKNIREINLSGYGSRDSDDPQFSIIFDVYWTISYLNDMTVTIPLPLGIEKDDGFIFGRARLQGAPQQP